jgi:hypothetical protein
MVVRSHEGREPVAPARVERTGARARGQHATHPGGVGAPPGSQYELPARSVATGAGAFARLSPETAKRGANTTGTCKARPDAEGERRTARRKAPRLRKKACTYGSVAPPGAPSPLYPTKRENETNLGRTTRRENEGG